MNPLTEKILEEAKFGIKPFRFRIIEASIRDTEDLNDIAKELDLWLDSTILNAIKRTANEFRVEEWLNEDGRPPTFVGFGNGIVFGSEELEAFNYLARRINAKVDSFNPTTK